MTVIHRKGRMTKSSFRRAVYSYYRGHRRVLPWRKTRNPYYILVSEVMLQQTQVERVQQKYERFIQAFPTFGALARAPLREVLFAWQGLGYNRRAKYLKEIAEIVMEKYHGRLPQDIRELERLPGIGPYTARAIAAFVFGRPHAFLETNIRTVLLHFFFKKRENVHDREILEVAEEMLDRENPREWYFALMDYGTMLKKRVGNENKRSAHYTKQSSFERSGRQLRGLILKELLRHGGLSIDRLAALTQRKEYEVSSKVQELMRDKLIVQKGGMFAVNEFV